MCARPHRIIAEPDVGKIDLLEISCGFVETEDKEEVVHVIAEVEDIEHLLLVAAVICRLKQEGAVALWQARQGRGRGAERGNRRVADRLAGVVDPVGREPHERRRWCRWKIADWSRTPDLAAGRDARGGFEDGSKRVGGVHHTTGIENLTLGRIRGG